MSPRLHPGLLAVALSAAPTLSVEVLASAPRYRMVLAEGSAEHGVQTLSLVANPAIGRGWVALAAEKIPAAKRVHLSADDAPAGQKQVLTGPALLPGQEILRLDAEGNPFYITFDAATIEATARQFAAQGRHNSTNQGHALGLSGNVVYESWMVADPANDKAAALGLDVPAGTWMLSVHVPDTAYWLAEVQSGNTTGFSIEGLFDSEQLTLSAVPAPAPVKKNWYTALTAMLLSLGGAKAAEIKVALGMETLADGRMVMVDDVSLAVAVCGPDGQPGEALPDGEYDLQNGGKLVVAGGKRADGEGQAALPTGGTGVAAATPPVTPPAAAGSADAAAGATAGLPAAVPPAATMEQLVTAVNALIEFVKKDEAADAVEDATSAPAAPKMAAALHGVAVAALKLDAVELDGGDTLTLNPVSKRLTTKDGALVESGYYAAKDGSYFQVSTDQYFWQIDKQTYDAVYSARLQAVELAEVKAKLAAAPGGKVVQLGGENGAEPALTKAQMRLARAEATR